MQSLPDAALDLLLGGACLGCGRPGRPVCAACRDGLPTAGRPAPPTPTPPGLVPAWAVGDYADLLRALVLAHKEHRVVGVREVLGELLTRAVTAAVGPETALVLVPVPSRRAVVRARGHDPTWEITRGAARLLRRQGYDVTARRLLEIGHRVADQAGLDSAQRGANLAGAMRYRPGELRRVARWRAAVRVVVCDDVLTTGATAREAQRALEVVGVPVVAIAAVAQTRRRLPPGAAATV